MIDEPVENASDSLTKPNCGVAHSTISSARRDRVHRTDRSCGERFEHEIPVRDPESSEFAVGRSKPSALAVMCRSIGKDVPASAGGAQRAFVETRARIPDPAAVARQHLST